MKNEFGTIESAVKRGNVIRNTFHPEQQTSLYLGSGSCGAVFDAFSLIGELDCQRHEEFGKFRHSDWFVRGQYGIDYWLSLFTLKFKNKPKSSPEKYHQELQLYQGRLTTAMILDGKSLSSEVWFHPYERHILTYHLCGAWNLEVVPETYLAGGYDESYTVQPEVVENGFRMKTPQASVDTRVRIVCQNGKAELKRDGAKIQLELSKDANCLLLIVSGSTDHFDSDWKAAEAIQNAEEWKHSAELGWKKRWGNSWLNITEDQMQKDWARSLYYILCSFSPDGIPPASMGWTGVGWVFHFPQDVSYIHPALLRLGHYDLAKRVVEFYKEHLNDMLAITHRIYGGRGAMWAWEFPIGFGTDYLGKGAPNVYQYEIHNAAYPVRMAYETSLHLNDPEWTREFALPVIRESAEFYASHMVLEEDGHYSLDVQPSMSQDEYGKPNDRNYLCALYSARYTFRIAGIMGLTDYRKYLDAGLAFNLLIDKEHGIYRTAENLTQNKYGNCKHPIQLNPLDYLPAPELNEYERNAYYQRYDICSRTKERFYAGWTLAMFWLASSHIGEAAELERELKLADDPDYRDPERLSFFETSKAPTYVYYMAINGIYLQAVQDAFVCDLFGETRIESAVPAEWKGSQYVNLHTHDGKTYSGTV